jgi:hypothetical protein
MIFDIRGCHSEPLDGWKLIVNAGCGYAVAWLTHCGLNTFFSPLSRSDRFRGCQ